MAAWTHGPPRSVWGDRAVYDQVDYGHWPENMQVSDTQEF